MTRYWRSTNRPRQISGQMKKRKNAGGLLPNAVSRVDHPSASVSRIISVTMKRMLDGIRVSAIDRRPPSGIQSRPVTMRATTRNPAPRERASSAPVGPPFGAIAHR